MRSDKKKNRKFKLDEKFSVVDEEPENINEIKIIHLLHCAAAVANETMIDRIINENKELELVNIKDIYGNTPLMWACM